MTDGFNRLELLGKVSSAIEVMQPHKLYILELREAKDPDGYDIYNNRWLEMEYFISVFFNHYINFHMDYLYDYTIISLTQIRDYVVRHQPDDLIIYDKVVDLFFI